MRNEKKCRQDTCKEELAEWWRHMSVVGSANCAHGSANCAQQLADLGLLISILYTAEASVWYNVEHTLDALRPRWSSLAVDLWNRPSNSSASEVRLALLQRHGKVIARFCRVLFLETAPRTHVPSHVRPSFSYRLHWHAAFTDPMVRQAARGRHAEGLPTLLAGVDADYYVPDNLPLDRFIRVLEGSQPTASEDAITRAKTRARRAWLRGRVPPCGKQPALHVRQRPSLPRTALEETGEGTASSTRSMCEVVSPAHRPLWVSPRDLTALPVEQRTSYAELGMYFYPLRLGNCCGRQNIDAPKWMRAASAAQVATLSRGPWCPPSTFWVLHRSSLGRLLDGMRLWQEAWDARALTRDLKRMRWEFVGCSLLAPGEAALLLYYNQSALREAATPAAAAAAGATV